MCFCISNDLYYHFSWHEQDIQDGEETYNEMSIRIASIRHLSLVLVANLHETFRSGEVGSSRSMDVVVSWDTMSKERQNTCQLQSLASISKTCTLTLKESTALSRFLNKKIFLYSQVLTVTFRDNVCTTGTRFSHRESPGNPRVHSMPD